MYSLYAVTVHSGSLGGGHYTAYVKLPVPAKSTASQTRRPRYQWYYASDSSVAPVDESRVLGAQAYMLFYRRE